MTIDINYKGIPSKLGIFLICFAMLMMLVATSGCITSAKNTYANIVKTPTPTPTPTPGPEIQIPTPRLTPAALPTLAVKPVNPYIHGERGEGQWFKWLRTDVSGNKDLFVGIVAYRHAWLDKYHWFNAAMGNYDVQLPSEGNRYFVVWIHEEMFGVNATYDPRMWRFNQNAFRLQYKNQLISPDTTHNPVNRILELDEKTDYYDTETAPPFGYKILYTGHDPETGGFAAEEIGYLRMGQGNSIDGYVLFEVPKSAFTEEVFLLGSFSTFGSAYWKFEDQ